MCSKIAPLHLCRICVRSDGDMLEVAGMRVGHLATYGERTIECEHAHVEDLPVIGVPTNAREEGYRVKLVECTSCLRFRFDVHLR
jgi:hypothetical protein